MTWAEVRCFTGWATQAPLSFSIYSIYHLKIVKASLLPYQFGCLLFLCVVWLPWTGFPVLCWTKWWEWTSCLVPDPRGKVLRYSLLRMMLAVSFSYVAFITLSYVPSKLTLLRVFITNGCCTLSKDFWHLLKQSHGSYLFSYFFLKILFYLTEIEREHKQGEWQAEGEAGSLLSKKPDGRLNPRTLGSLTELKADT